MEKFSFENYRDNLAKELKDTKRNVGHIAAREKSRQEKITENYQTAKSLRDIKKTLPEDVVADVLHNFKEVEREDDPNNWDVENIADKVPQEFKYLIDSDILSIVVGKMGLDNEQRYEINESIRRVVRNTTDDVMTYEYKERRQKVYKLVDMLMEGSFLDEHNLNHVVTGLSYSDKHTGEASFDRYSNIEPSQGNEWGKDGLWTTPHGNLYSTKMRPIVNFSPNNLATHLFFENAFYPPINTMLEHLKLEAQRKYVGSADEGESNLERLYFLAGLPMPKEVGLGLFFDFESVRQRDERVEKGDTGRLTVDVNWMEIADKILDFKSGKIWKRKHTKEELNEVKNRQEFYQEWIKENLEGN